VKSYKNLYPQVCSLENVMAAARSAMQGKMSGHAAARFHARWETHAVRLHEELTTDTWRPGPYTYFDIHEPKLRRVAAAPFRDRVVHHALVRVLEPIFEKKFIEDSYACRKGKGTHAGVVEDQHRSTQACDRRCGTRGATESFGCGNGSQNPLRSLQRTRSRLRRGNRAPGQRC
jgi:hypothetical protein